MARDSIARGLALAAPSIVAQSAVQSPHTGDTTETTLATITIPAGAIGANGRLEIRASFTVPNSSNTKTLRVKFGGTTLFSTIQTTVTGADVNLSIANRNSTASQRASGTVVNSSGNSGLVTNPATIDTTASVNLTITGQLALGTETVTLESYQVILYPKP